MRSRAYLDFFQRKCHLGTFSSNDIHRKHLKDSKEAPRFLDITKKQFVHLHGEVNYCSLVIHYPDTGELYHVIPTFDMCFLVL